MAVVLNFAQGRANIMVKIALALLVTVVLCAPVPVAKNFKFSLQREINRELGVE
jgi:hypothetical protein